MNIISFVNRLVNKFNSWLYVFVNGYRFGRVGSSIRINTPLKIQGHENIYFDDNVQVGELSWLAALPLTGSNALLRIGAGSQIGHFNHIFATRSIVIEKNVLTADRVYISDNSHSYEDIDAPIWKQPIKQLNNVVIGEGSWIGENVCIIGASVGKHCVVGANSVVTKDIPDYCVAVGAPAKVIKKLKV